MIAIYVYNQSVELIGIITKYKSVIWANRYAKTGDCELYLPATSENIEKLKIGYYLGRPDDNMICRIDKIEIKTDAEEGNYLTVTGTDVKGMLDQRIIWGTVGCGGALAEPFVRRIVQTQLINAVNTARWMTKPDGTTLFTLGTLANLTENDYQQFSYTNLGEFVRGYCDLFGWGYRVWNNTGIFQFEIYKGTDRSASVVFSREFDNLLGSDFVDNYQDLANVALVGGEGDGASRKTNSFGGATGVDRYEIFVDRKTMSSEITYSELKATYPLTGEGGRGYLSGTGYYYRELYIQIMDNAERTWLANNYPTGVEVTVNGELYYYLEDVKIASLPSSSPSDNDKVTLTNLIYYVYMLNAGMEELSKHGETIAFDATILPEVTFRYRSDYYLGDIVTILDDFGNEAQARISEVIEVFDENGYSCNPQFTYTTFNRAPFLSEPITTEAGDPITTEDGEELETEGN